MADDVWQNTGGGDWNTASDWSDGAVPNGTSDAASFSKPGTYTVTIADGESEMAGAVNLTDPGATLDIQDGGTLALAGADPLLTLAAGTLELEQGGVLQGATINGGGGTIVTTGGTLIDDRISGNVIVTNLARYGYSLNVEGGLSGGGTIDVVGISLSADQTETFNNATILLDASSSIIESAYDYQTGTGGTLTFGPSSVLEQAAGTSSQVDSEYSASAVVNEGTIDADGSSLDISAPGFTNTGTIAVSGTSTLEIDGSLTNTGSITVDAGGTLNIGGDQTTASLGAISNAGVLDIIGTLDAGGGTIDVAPGTAYGTLELQGTIENATIKGDGGTLIAANGVLLDDRVTGDLLVSGKFGGLTVLGGLTGGGTIDLTATNASLYANQTETFDNTTVLLGNGSELVQNSYTYDATSNQAVGGTLTLGSHFVLDGTGSSYAYLAGDYSGSEILNAGTINASGASLRIQPAIFVNTGTITVGGSSALAVYGSFTNAGSVTIDAGGTLEIGGAIDIAGLGAITNAGTLDILNGGTLDAAGETVDIALATAFATLVLQGVVENATIEVQRGSFIAQGGTLSNDRVVGDVAVSNQYNGLTILGGLSGGGTLDLSAGYDQSIYVAQTETFDHATLLLGSSDSLQVTAQTYDATSQQYLGGTLTLGPDFVIAQATTAFSYLQGSSTGNEIINQGTIDANGEYLQISPSNFVNTGTITVGPTATLEIYGSFTNTGSITIDSGGTLEIAGTTDLASLASIGNSGVLDIASGSTLDGGGGTIDIASDTAFASLELSGTIENATLLGAGGTLVAAGGTLLDDRIAGDVAFANNYSGLAVLGGLSGGGTLDLSSGYAETVYADQSETFDNAALVLGNGDVLNDYASTYDATSQQYLGGTLTLGPHFTITQMAASNAYLQGSYAGATIVNEGTILAEGSYTQVSSPQFINAGTITIGGTDTFETTGTFVNTGSMSVTAGGVFKISGLASLSALGAISNAGTLDINGTLDGGGGTIDIAPTTAFSTLELQGTIENATLKGNAGNFTIAGGTLQNDRIAGDVVIANPYSSLAVTGGLSGGGTLDLSAAYDDTIYATQAETFDHATLVLGNSDSLVDYAYIYDPVSGQDVGQTLTLGPNFVLAQGTADTSYLSGDFTGNTIVNKGTILANGAYTQINPTNFDNIGTIIVGGTDTFRIYGSFTNTGSITVDAGGTLEIAGTTDLADLVPVANAGLIAVSGTLDGGGGTIDIAPATAFATLELSGTVENATLLGAGGTLIAANGTLANDRIAGDVVVTNDYDGLAVTGGLSGGGTLDLSATNDTVYAVQTETFDDVTVVLGNGAVIANRSYTYDATSAQNLGGTLTLGTGFIVTQAAGSNAYIEGEFNGAAIVNEGRILASGNYTEIDQSNFLNAGTIVVGGTDTLRVYSTFANTGIISSIAGTGAFVQFESADGLAVSELTGGTYAALNGSDLTLSLGGLPTILGATVELDGSGAAIGIVNPANNATLDYGSVLTEIASGGTLVLSDGAVLASGGLTVDAGGTIFGAGTITGALVDNGLVEAHGGTLSVDLSGTGTLEIDPGAVLAIAGAATGVTVAFNGVGTLDLADPAGFAGTIANLGTDSVLSLSGVSITSGTIEGNNLVLAESGGGSLTYALASPSPALSGVFIVPTGTGNTLEFKSNTEAFASDEFVQLSGTGTLTRAGNDVTVAVGNLRQNAASPTVTLGVANTQASGTDTLSGSFATTVAAPYSASGFAAFSGVAAGITIDAGSIALNTAGAGGIVSSHVTLSGTSEGTTTTPLAAAVATITATLYDQATATLSSAAIVMAARVAAGGTLVEATQLSNGLAHASYTENLDYNLASVPTGFALDPSTAAAGTLASGNAAALDFDVSTSTAGAFSGTASLALATDGNGIDGLGTLALASQSVSLTADIYGTAQIGGFGTIVLPTILHTNDSVTSFATITNPSVAALQDDLYGSLASASGLTADNGSFDTPAGSATTLGFGLDTSTTGAHVATASYDLDSYDSQLGYDALATPGTLAFDYTVQNFATAALSEPVGAGTLTSSSANNYVLNFGTIVAGGPSVSGTLDVANIAKPVADWLDGTLFAVGSTFDFTNHAFNISELLAGQSPDILGAITFDPTTDGNYAETLMLQPYSGNANGDTARPDIFITVEAKVVSATGGGGGGGGHTTPGHTTSGHTTAGPTTSGQTTSGQTTSGDTTSGHTTSSHTTSSHTTHGQTTSGHSSSAQSSGGQSSGGRSSGGYTTGGGAGDTHLLDFNKSRYDFQAAGEFVLAKNKDIQVQIRLEPGSGRADQPSGSVSYITQTAIAVGNERITIDFTRTSPLYVDGAPVTLQPGQYLKLPGVTIYDDGSENYLIQASTGERVRVGFESTTVAVDGKGGPTTGLLGGGTTPTADTFMLPDGTVLTSPLTFDQLYQTFGDAWRVTTSTSLFDYTTDPTTGLVEDTTSPQITNLDFPANPVSVASLPTSVVQQAQQAVAGLGITDPQQQQNAILDYVLSGGNIAAVGSDYNAQQQGQTGGTQAAITNPPPPDYVGIIPPAGTVTVNGTAETAAFEVYRTGNTSSALTLAYQVEAPGAGGDVTSAEYGGVLASGTITIAAGQTAATLDITTPGSLVLPAEQLLVGISTTDSGVVLVNNSAQASLITTQPVHGLDSAPAFYHTTGPGSVTTAGSVATFDLGTIGADGIGTLSAALGNKVFGYGNSLGGTLSVLSGDGFDITGLGTVDLAPLTSENIHVGPQVTTLGTHTETLAFSPTSFNASGYTGTLAPQYLVITDVIVDPTAMPSALPATETLIGRTGGNFSTAVMVGNQAVIGSDDLDVTLIDTGGHVVVGSAQALAPGADTALALNEAPRLAAGTFSDTLDVGYVSHDPNAHGHADVTLPGTVATLDGTVYTPAIASFGTRTIDFGTVHQGASDPIVSLKVTNTGSGAFADDLIATAGSLSVFNGTGSLDLAAGTSGTLEFGLDTTKGGVFTSSALVTVASHDGAQNDLALGTRAITLKGTVIADAAPGFAEVSGPGSIVYASPTLETLDLGTIVEGVAVALTIAMANTATGLADTLYGSLEFISSGSTIDLGTISAIAAGSTSGAFGVTFDPAAMGDLAGTIEFGGVSVGSAGTVALAPDLLEITGTVVCFCPGTRIATPDGECAVEDLRAGDLVLTADGAARPVRWLGRQTVATRFADRFRVAPIRIRAHALGEHQPVRDLLVSPDHALMVDGVFVQAGALVNGVSILREDAHMPERFTYFHVELSDHSLIVAEGVLAETFIDNVDRLHFDNWDEHVALGTDSAPMSEMALPRAKSHRQMPRALRASLMARAVELYGREIAGIA